MANTFKRGLDFFSHQTDASNDDKIQFIEAIYGIQGYAVYFKLLEKIYYNGYFKIYKDRDIILFANAYKIEIDVCRNIINDCINENLFSKKLFDKYKILTSESIQKRFLVGAKRREKLIFVKEFILVNKKEIDVDSIEIVEYINSENADINLHSIVEYSKEEDSIVKHSKDFEQIHEVWNSFAKQNGLSQLKALNKARQKKLLKRIQEKPFNFFEILELIKTSDFLLGKVDKWRVSFDWVIENETNYLKILEGNYKNGTSKKSQPARVGDNEDRERNESFLAKLIGQDEIHSAGESTDRLSLN